jgi:hypothetical protein
VLRRLKRAKNGRIKKLIRNFNLITEGSDDPDIDGGSGNTEWIVQM